MSCLCIIYDYIYILGKITPAGKNETGLTRPDNRCYVNALLLFLASPTLERTFYNTIKENVKISRDCPIQSLLYIILTILYNNGKVELQLVNFFAEACQFDVEEQSDASELLIKIIESIEGTLQTFITINIYIKIYVI